MIKKIKHIIKGWGYSFRGINFELMEERMKQCQECSEILYITKNTPVCQICGCFLKKKNRVKEERCPQNKG